MAATKLRLSYATTDGKTFYDAREAAKHQRRLDAIAELAALFREKFELDENVGLNIAATLAEVPETVFAAMGRTFRRSKDEDGASDAADGSAGTDASDAADGSATPDA